MATVKKIDKVATEQLSGVLVEYEFENGYKAQPFFIKDGVVLESQAQERRGRSGMPVKYAYCSGKDIDWSWYGNEDTTAQRAIVNSFVTRFDSYRRQGRGLYLYSQTRGSGKTMIACALANEIIKKYNTSVKFISAAEYIEVVRGKSEQDREHVEQLLDCGLLILDDIGAQMENKDWIVAALARLIDRRYSNHLPTIFTSNLQIGKLKLDSRTLERIYEISTHVIMPEVNVRRKIAEQHTQDFMQEILQQAESEA